MKQVIDRICSFFLVLVMLTTLLPVAAMAANAETHQAETDEVEFGGEPIMLAEVSVSQEEIELGEEIFIFINELIERYGRYYNQEELDKKIEERLIERILADILDGNVAEGSGGIILNELFDTLLQFDESIESLLDLFAKMGFKTPDIVGDSWDIFQTALNVSNTVRHYHILRVARESDMHFEQVFGLLGMVGSAFNQTSIVLSRAIPGLGHLMAIPLDIAERVIGEQLTVLLQIVANRNFEIMMSLLHAATIDNQFLAGAKGIAQSLGLETIAKLFTHL